MLCVRAYPCRAGDGFATTKQNNMVSNKIRQFLRSLLTLIAITPDYAEFRSSEENLCISHQSAQCIRRLLQGPHRTAATAALCLPLHRCLLVVRPAATAHSFYLLHPRIANAQSDSTLGT